MTARITVNVKPNSKNPAIEVTETTITLKLRERPIENAANQACLKALANYLDVPPSTITLIRGEKSRTKQFSITALDEAEVFRRLQDAAKAKG